TERVRINEIMITAIPPAYDRLSDGGWFVSADYRFVSGGYDPSTDVDWNLVHELSHQVGLIDLYQSGIYATVVHVLDREGGPANVGFAWANPGLMGGGDISPHTDPHLYASHSAAGFSATKGYRRGYYGEYQFDIPAQNYLQVLDNQGAPAPGVEVALYQRTGPTVWPGDATIDNTPEISGTTGADGRFLLPNRSVGGGVTTYTGHTLHDNPFGVVDVVGKKNVFLIKLDKGDHQEFAWTDVTAFNLAFWSGDTISHTFVLSAHVPPPAAPAPPPGAVVRCEMSVSTLCWDPSPSPDVAGYHVYRAAPPAYVYEPAGGLLSGPCFSELYGATRIYAVTAVDSLGQESGFSNFAWAPRLMRPYAVELMSDGQRTVLDPQNGYALLRQRPDGRYLQNIGSVHYHLENSLYLDVDPDDRLILSHPADWYNDRHSVRVADRDASPQFEFGTQGSGPGQFETPAGVVAVGPPLRFLVADAGNHRLQAFDEAGNFVTAYGSLGSGPGQFSSPQGLAVDRDGLVLVADSGNDRLQVLRFDGLSFDYLRTLTAGLSYPTGLDVDGANRILVADSGNDRVVVLNAAGHLLAEFTEPNDGYSGPFNQPRDVLADGAGNLVVADTFNGRVVTVLDALPPGSPSVVYLPLVLRNHLHQPIFECQEQLQNGGFEEEGAWVVSSTPRPARYVSELAHGGERSVLLGLKPGESDVHSYSSVWQAVSLPADVYSATLTFWHYPLSDLDEGDRQECLLLDDEGDLLEIVHRDNLNTAAWTRGTYDLAAYAGETIRIYCNAYNDGDDAGVTGFYLDDVSLVTCALRP
ncbi:MAG: 6-bladed beta-propeller, partial [Anaerolineae bacterium]